MKGQPGEWEISPVALTFSFHMNTCVTSKVQSTVLSVSGEGGS